MHLIACTLPVAKQCIFNYQEKWKEWNLFCDLILVHQWHPPPAKLVKTRVLLPQRLKGPPRLIHSTRRRQLKFRKWKKNFSPFSVTSILGNYELLVRSLICRTTQQSIKLQRNFTHADCFQGHGCSMEEMEQIRDQQENLAKLHFDLAGKQDLSAPLNEEGKWKWFFYALL